MTSEIKETKQAPVTVILVITVRKLLRTIVKTWLLKTGCSWKHYLKTMSSDKPNTDSNGRGWWPNWNQWVPNGINVQPNAPNHIPLAQDPISASRLTLYTAVAVRMSLTDFWTGYDWISAPMNTYSHHVDPIASNKRSLCSTPDVIMKT
jgi:hypothetical protein